jgi:hypothetical protein
VHRTWLRWSLAAALLAALAAGSVWAWRLSADRLGVLWTVVPGMLAVVAAIAPWVTRSRPPVPAAPPGQRTALEELARRVKSRWRTEEAVRGLLEPWPLPVRWATTARAEAVMAGWAAIRGVASDHRPLPMAGQFTGIADVFTAPEAPRRLVVLGRGGAGKSMLARRLVLDLLERRQPGDPVPVLFTMDSWDPGTQSLDGWIAQRLCAEYAFLARRAELPDRVRRTVADELVADGRIVAVLDGFDEISGAQRTPALLSMRHSVQRHGQLLVTSRPVEYEQAVAADAPLAGTPVVEIFPLEPADVVEYLIASTAGPASRWEPVTDRLRAHPHGPLARALSTPLMIWLARTIYHAGRTDPGALVQISGDRAAIEGHLLDALLPAVYRVIAGDPERPRATAAQAHRWLTFIAVHVTRERTFGLYWWRLHQAVSRVGFAVLLSVPWAVLGLLTAGPVVGLPAGAVVGILFGVSRLSWGTLFLAWSLTLACLFAGGFLFGYGMPVAGVALMIAATGLFLAPAGMFRTGGNLRLGRHSALVRAPAAGLLFATVYAVVRDPYRGPLPIEVAHLLGLACAAAIAWTLTCTQWGGWLLARTWLALTFRLPWRLGAFLRDAHRRGVLRNEGGVYQFRHARLQDRLAADRARP